MTTNIEIVSSRTYYSSLTSLTTWTKRGTRDDFTRISRAINRALRPDLLMLKQHIDLQTQSDNGFEWIEDEWAQQLAVSRLMRVETGLDFATTTGYSVTRRGELTALICMSPSRADTLAA